MSAAEVQPLVHELNTETLPIIATPTRPIAAQPKTAMPMPVVQAVGLGELGTELVPVERDYTRRAIVGGIGLVAALCASLTAFLVSGGH